MTIDYTTNIATPNYSARVLSDAAYLAIDPLRRNNQFEQELLTLIEVTRAFMANMRDDVQARMFMYAMNRMTAAANDSYVYTDLTIRVIGNDPGVIVSAKPSNTLTVTVGGTTATVSLVGGPFATIALLVADINGQLGSVPAVAAYDAGSGRLGFRNTSGNLGTAFSLGYGAGPSLLPKAGITAGAFVNTVTVRANIARDDAIQHFERGANPLVP